MALPEAAERTNNARYEEINIPLTEPAPTEVGNTLIPIASLDDISRRAFGNCKYLNKIQSVVFETAYRTNENMLVCAPTGAGKTNIAMLTILHQIKQYITNGVLERKDQFKVKLAFAIRFCIITLSAFISPLDCLCSTDESLGSRNGRKFW